MFIFYASLEPKELIDNADFALNIGQFTTIIQGDHITCHLEERYKDSLDEETRKLAIKAMRCVALSQAAESLMPLTINPFGWAELKLTFEDIKKNLVLGNILSPTKLPIEKAAREAFLTDFGSGLRYANQAFSETAFLIALEDFTRAIASEWDEAIYHCQHCLECIRDYFGNSKAGWEIMRNEMDLDEAELREVTDFSADYIRHGTDRAKLEALSNKEKSAKVKRSIWICQGVIAKFGVYLDENNVHFSIIKQTGYSNRP